MDETMGTFTAFSGTSIVARGSLEETLLAVKRYADSGSDGASVLVFEDKSGMQCDFDLRGTAEDVLHALSAHPVFGAKKRAGPGRPKLGVLSREISLLPRHWAWLEQQPSGVSVALRRLVEEASTDKARVTRATEREGLEALGKVMWAVAGNLDGFEEASRALYAKDGACFAKLVRSGPKDLRRHLLELYTRAVPATSSALAGRGDSRPA